MPGAASHGRRCATSRSRASASGRPSPTPERGRSAKPRCATSRPRPQRVDPSGSVPSLRRIHEAEGRQMADELERGYDGGEAWELLLIEEADAWYEYLEATRGQTQARYRELEPWAWSRLTQRLRAIRARRSRLRPAAA